MRVYRAEVMVTFRELNPGESETLERRKIPDDQAALYGFPDNLKPQKEL
jgi:hypothetical protein